jgi:tRNA (guanine37-N1)-methyltransferase
MLFVKVKSSEGEETRIRLVQLKMIAIEYSIERKGEFLYFPIKKEMEEAASEYATAKLHGKKIKQKKSKTLEEALSGKLTPEEIQEIVTSFDIIGTIAITEIPPKMEKYEKEIAKALMKVHPNIKTVAKKLGGMEGEFRVRPIKVIAGKKSTETEYRESGCRITMDAATTYFSVRLSHERERIAAQVNDGERILALFAGVGPFPLVIARTKPTYKLNIASIELNPDAVKYMRKNVVLNKCEGKIEPILGDARTVVNERFVGWADRILMPLPKSAEDFLDVAFIGAKNGAIVHFYTFVNEDRAFEEAKEKVERAVEKFEKERGCKIRTEILFQRIVRPYAPRVVQVVTDFRVVK